MVIGGGMSRNEKGAKKARKEERETRKRKRVGKKERAK